MSAADRIRRCAQAIARELGGNHLRFMPIVSVVLFADEGVNNLDNWDAVRDREFQGAYREGLAEVRERIAGRVSRAADRVR